MSSEDSYTRQCLQQLFLLRELIEKKGYSWKKTEISRDFFVLYSIIIAQSVKKSEEKNQSNYKCEKKIILHNNAEKLLKNS